MRIFIFFSLILLTTWSFEGLAQKEEQRFEFSTEKSYVKWIAQEGEDKQYVGSFKLKSGYVVMKGEKMEMMTVFVDARSLQCDKCGSDAESKKLVEFMKSEKFLNTGIMDFASFKMYENQKLENNQYRLKGLLSMIAYSNEISFPAEVAIKKDKLTAQAEFTINRDLWNLKNPNDGRESHPGSTITLQVYLESKDKE